MKRISLIGPTDKNFFKAAKNQWDSIAKPLGSLGLLEESICKIAAVQKTTDVDISRRTVVVMCADNGVVAEGVTQIGSYVTKLSSEAIACGRSNIDLLAETFDAKVLAVDIGINGEIDCPALLDRKIAHGTANIAKGAAMTLNEAERAVSVGMDIVKELRTGGTKIIVTGEMGIGNTTTAAAISAVLLDLPAEAVTGRGAGLSDEGLARKTAAVKQAIEINAPDIGDPVGMLAKIGGFDIAGMAGVFLGGAVYGIPVVIDGIISAAAANIACLIEPLCREYMLAGHISGEPAGKALLDKIGLCAPINAGLRLGEGTGGIMLLPLLDGALAVYRNSHRFEETGIERYVEL